MSGPWDSSLPIYPHVVVSMWIGSAGLLLYLSLDAETHGTVAPVSGRSQILSDEMEKIYNNRSDGPKSYYSPLSL